MKPNLSFSQLRAISRLAHSTEEDYPSNFTKVKEQVALMQEIVVDDTLWNDWQRTLALAQHSLRQEGREPDVEMRSSLLAWARRSVRSPQRLWSSVLQVCRRRLAERTSSYLESLSWLVQGQTPLRARGDGVLPPVAVFSEVPLELSEDRCSFSLQAGKVYAFTTYLPQQGHVAVLQVETQGEDVESHLLYPQHGTHLHPMGPGGVHLFSTQFEEVGTTQFLVLFSEIPFASLSPHEWEEEIEAWSWEPERLHKVADYLLRHAGVLEPFLLQVDVREAENS
jgi:hypothetical protein